MSQSLLNKINQLPLLSHVFNFLPKKRALKVAIISKQLSSELNISFDNYLLDEPYRKIILRSKGSVNDIYNQAIQFYKDSDNKLVTFPEMIQKMVKYMKYLYIKKVFKYYLIILEHFLFFHWPHISFLIEVIRGLKKGISIKVTGVIKFRFYDILRDAIINLEEVHSVSNYTFAQNNRNLLTTYQLYYEMFDWTKVRCIDLLKCPSGNIYKGFTHKYILIPDNATFRKIIIDNGTFANCNELAYFMNKHGAHVEYLKIFNISDNNLGTEFFSNLNGINKVKLISCKHFTFFNFLIYFKKYLSQIKNLVLDNILYEKYNNISEKKEHFYLMQNVLPRLNNLEKVELNFTKISNVGSMYKLLSTIVSQNPNLKELKISLTFQDKMEIQEENKSATFLEKFIGQERNVEEDNLKEFYTLIKIISDLKQLSNLELNFELDDKMTQIVSTFLNVGNNLKNLAMIHTNKLNLTQLLKAHPYLNQINLCLDQKVEEETKRKFNYEFAQRSWKSISLKNYPLNNSFIDALIKTTNSLHDLTLENTFNVCEKSLAEVNNILLGIKNNIL